MAVQRIGNRFDDTHFMSYDQPHLVGAGATPNTPYPGMSIYETDTERAKFWDGTTWDTFYSGAIHQTTTVTTTWESAGSPTVTYERIGRLVYADYLWTLTGTPTGSNADLAINFPAGLTARYALHPIGTARLGGFTSMDVNAICRTGSPATVFYIAEEQSGAVLNRTGNGATTGDTIRCSIKYEIATSIS